MPVIAVVNRKGGSGKSTLAAHLATWCVRQGHTVMLADADRQQSSRAWLRRRSSSLPAITPWTMDQNVLKIPSGISHAVLDTPGGLQGFELARVVMSADAIVIPVGASLLDRESAAASHAELMTLPRVASGRCRVGVVGMRIDARTRAADTLRDWAKALGVEFLGILRNAQTYVQSHDAGTTIFDLPPQQAQADLTQWQPIIDWLTPLLATPRMGDVPGAAPRVDSLIPAHEPLVHGARLGVLSSARPETHRPPARTLAHAQRAVPQFLKR